ncbi:MAG: ribonuclease III [Chloroflexota bacterium]|nr:ribonuclease III [Chloroflexota bacterium]
MTNSRSLQAISAPLERALRFEETSGLNFKDKTLLQRALTHRSYINESPWFIQADNERLEFLGDAVLDFVIGEQIYHRFPELREGPLTNLRAALVREETLASFARELQLGRFLLLGRGEDETGGRERPAILCAGFEALVGALYLDQDLEAVDNLLFPLVEPVLPEMVEQAAIKDAKSRLQEWSQSELRSTPRYQTVAAEGPDHAKLFTVQVLVNGEIWGRGDGQSKQKASQRAAADALRRLEIGQPIAQQGIVAREDVAADLIDTSALVENAPV